MSNTTVNIDLTDEYGVDWNLKADVEGNVVVDSFDLNRPYKDQSGIWVEFLTISNVLCKTLTETKGTTAFKIQLLEDMPNYFAESELNRVREQAVTNLLEGAFHHE